ncbi:MAG: head GIN domain-containing protein [Chitinophagales bacterium]
MKKLNILVCSMAAIGSMFIHTSCNDRWPCIHGSGPVISETRSISGFTEVSNEIEANVYITEGAAFEVVISGQQNILDNIETHVSGAELRITTDHCIQDADMVNIYITMPVVNALSLSGSGSLITQNAITTEQIDIDLSGSGAFVCNDTIHASAISMDLSGSGNMQLIADAGTVDTDISGSGDVTITGNGNTFTYNMSGSGKMHAFYFYIATAHVHMSGSGDMELNATDLIEGSISGSGDLYYKNTPAINVSFSGSGQLIHVN